MSRWTSHRIARRDLGAIDEAQARALLDEYATAITVAVRQATRHGHRVGLEPEDLRLIAQVAALEASLSYRSNAAATRRTWIKKVIRWRIAEALEGAERPEVPLEAPHRLLNGRNPEEVFEEGERSAWLHSQIGKLEIRQRTILACRLEGESLREIGATLGISHTRVHQEIKRAFATLREVGTRQGYLDEEPPKT